VPVDFVAQDGEYVRVESTALGIAFEGRFDAASGEIRGAVELGPLELPLVLRRLGAGDP